jgi:cell division GTPase FtsZ
MRVLLVGIGGAGCRIADALSLQDIRSRSLRCTDAVAVDSNADELNALQTIPPGNRIFYQSLDPFHTMNTPDLLPLDEIIARLHSIDPGDIDALVIVSGLGGEMASLIPDLVLHIRDRMTEPVFGLLTLPCTREGETVLARAAAAVDALIPMLDGIFLYDNELWYERARADQENEEGQGRDLEIRLPWQKQAPPEQKIPAGYAGINSMIARQISLLLRAGEVSDRPGTEAAEVALDAGEVLNTIRGMGCIAIGYDREHIPAVNPDLITRLRPAGHAIQESHQRASRIVTMARKALGEGISVSCEIEGAKKALVLVAGPPHELSMRGYMTVRHWIDRSISGQEVRSGDYPLSGTRFIAILIVLSGLDRIPRVDSLREIREGIAKTKING